jgi:phosphate transport system substrate-binding protein
MTQSSNPEIGKRVRTGAFFSNVHDQGSGPPVMLLHGSGAGVRQLIANTVDFAATDTPVSSNDRQAIGRGVVEIPLTAGAIAIAYHLPGCQLKLSQGQLAGIFLGTIRNYKELGCSNQAITVVHRSDGSGTTYNFTHSLTAFSKAWKQGPGFGKSVQWPTGIGAKGNEGIAATVSQLKGALGYMEASYVRGNLQAAAISQALAPTGTQEEQNAALTQALSDLSQEVQVQISPRFGTWDPAQIMVGAPAFDLSSPPMGMRAA